MVDSLQIYEILKGGNLPEEHARAMTIAIQKAESQFSLDVRTIIDPRFAEVGRRFAEVDRRFDAIDRRFDGLHAIFATKAELAEVKAELIRWMFVFWVGQVAATVGIVFAAFKLLK